MPEVEYNERKLGELIVLIASLSRDDPAFGDVKLNKLLFFSDFLAYANLGHPITGAAYQKLEFGPAPRRLLPVREHLVHDEAVEVSTVGLAYPRRVTVPLREPGLSLFEADEVALVREVVDLFEHADASTISRISHRVSAGWNLVELQETIPYESALIATDPAPPEAIERGLELAERFGW
jgi:hypothetical protein